MTWLELIPFITKHMETQNLDCNLQQKNSEKKNYPVQLTNGAGWLSVVREDFTAATGHEFKDKNAECDEYMATIIYTLCSVSTRQAMPGHKVPGDNLERWNLSSSSRPSLIAEHIVCGCRFGPETGNYSRRANHPKECVPHRRMSREQVAL